MTEDKTTLTAAEVDAELQTLAGWSRNGIIISRDFVFTNFKDITSFLNHLTRTITEQNHHPDFSLDTGKRTIAVSMVRPDNPQRRSRHPLGYPLRPHTQRVAAGELNFPFADH